MNPTSVGWAGLNRLALITDDMDTTARFWHRVLGAPLVAIYYGVSVSGWG